MSPTTDMAAVKVDVDGYPTICCRCGKPIVKARSDSQHHYDHQAGAATSWHVECTTVVDSRRERHACDPRT